MKTSFLTERTNAFAFPILCEESVGPWREKSLFDVIPIYKLTRVQPPMNRATSDNSCVFLYAGSDSMKILPYAIR